MGEDDRANTTTDWGALGVARPNRNGENVVGKAATTAAKLCGDI